VFVCVYRFDNIIKPFRNYETFLYTSALQWLQGFKCRFSDSTPRLWWWRIWSPNGQLSTHSARVHCRYRLTLYDTDNDHINIMFRVTPFLGVGALAAKNRGGVRLYRLGSWYISGTSKVSDGPSTQLYNWYNVIINYNIVIL